MNNEDKILAMLENIQNEISDIKMNMATKQEIQKGFERIETLINIAANDAARTEKLLREHIEQPIH